jgi:hypothetical protein
MPDIGRDAKGGVPLPKLTLEPASATGGAAGIAACREAQAPYPQQLNEAIAGAPGLPDPTFAPISRGFGEVLVVRGRAPTFADTRGGAGSSRRGYRRAIGRSVSTSRPRNA